MRSHPTHQRQSHALTAQKSLDELQRLTQNKATLKAYMAALSRFQRHGFSLQTMIDYDKRERTDAMASYIRMLNESGVTTSTIRAELAALVRWTFCNRIEIDQKYLSLSVKSDDIPLGGGLPYSDEDVSAMYLSCKSDGERLLLVFLATTGTRPGSLFEDETLKVSDISGIEGHSEYASMPIYKGTRSQYDVILGRQFMNHLSIMKKGGLFDDNPILFQGKFGSSITRNEIDSIFKRLVKSAKITREKTGHRYSKSIIYGLRKRFNTKCKSQQNVNYNIVEKLIGHSVSISLDNNYLAPSTLQLLQEYKKFESSVSIRT